jgi:hypothetical protein
MPYKNIEDKRRQWREAKARIRLLHPERFRYPYRKNYHSIYREKVFANYGMLCECCGESHIEFMTIDHIHGGGAKHRRQIKKALYRWLVSNNFPEGFRTLCFNCNTAIGRFGYCPHNSPLAGSSPAPGKRGGGGRA